MPDLTAQPSAVLSGPMRRVLEAMGDGFFACDAAWDFVYLNPAAERILRVDRDEVTGRNHWEVFPQTLGTPLETEYRRAAAGEVRDFENFFEPWGRWFHNRCFPFPEGGMAVYFEDITERKLGQQALVESEAQFRSLFESSVDAIVLGDPGGRVTAANPAACELFQMTEEEILRAGRAGLEDPSDPVPSSAFDERARTGRVRFETTHVRKDGSRFPTEVTSVLVDGGRRSIVFIRDITERRQAEKALRASEERHRELVESANSAILRWQPDGAITFVNEYAERLFGWGAGELLGRRVGVLLPGVEAPAGGLSGLVADILAHAEWYVSNVNENVRKDGGRLWVAWTNRALLDEQGEVREMLAIGNDVTELVEAQASQRASEERLTLALAAGGIAAWDNDFASGKVTWNAEHFTMLGYEVGEVEPSYETFHARVHPDDAARVSDAFFGSIERAGDYEAEFRALLPGGVVRWIDAYGHLVIGPDGAPRRSYGVMLDVTEHKEAEDVLRQRGAERAAQAERSRLARDLHDSVTQALFAASLKAEALMLTSETFSPETAKTVEELRRLSRGALAQMRTMLLELRSEPFEQVPLRQLLRNLVEATESRASLNVGLAVRGEHELPPEVHVALYRIVEEALNNVARHARAQRAWVELDLSADGARLIVGDDGVGFDPAVNDPSHLGLRSMRERADEVGAELTVVTHAGEGTAVVVVWEQG